MTKQFSQACERNQAPILQVLQQVFASCTRVLEVGSGTGQHAVYFAQHLPHVTWQTSDLLVNHPSILAWQAEAQCAIVLPPLVLDVAQDAWPLGPFDAVFSANTCHIMAWPNVEKMFAGVAQVVEVGGVLAIYGPFNYGGTFTSASNAQFDAYLKSQAAHMGIRDSEKIMQLATQWGFDLVSDYAMPANNRLLVWRRVET